MASSAEETQKMRDAAIEARDNFKAISDILAENLATTKASADVMGRIKDNLKGQISLEDQITVLEREKNLYLTEYLKSGKSINEDLIKKLDLSIELLKKEKERQDVQEEIKNLGKDFKDKMLGSLGTLGDMVKAGTALGAGMVLAQKGIEMISSAFNATVGLAKELYTQVGATGAEAARLGSQTMSAMFSMEGLLYGGQALATAAKDASDYYGSTKVITADMQKNITKLSAMGVSGATQMNAIFESASGNAGGLTAEIQAMAQDAGVNASQVFKEMEGSMISMVGKSKEEIKYLAQKTIQLQKQGISMSLMESMSNNMLNMESSLRAQQKARQFGLGEMLGDTEALRTASAEIQFGDKAKGMEMLADAMKDAGLTSESLGNMGARQVGILAEAYGMSGEQLTEMVTKQEELSKIMDETGAKTTAEAIAIQEQRASVEALKQSAISYGASIGTAVLPALAQWFATKQAISALGSGTGGGAAAAAGGGAPGGGMLQGIANMPWRQILMGAAAMLIVAASVYVFGEAVQKFMEVSWEAVGMAVVSMLALVAAVALLGAIMMSGVGAVAILAGAAAMLVIASAMLVLGIAIQEIAKGFGMMGELTGQLTALVTIAPGLIALAGIFAILGASLIALSVGLAAVSLFLPTIMVLGLMLPLITGALGIGGGESSENSSSENSEKNDELLEEIKGLRQDIQSQPLQVVMDGKVLSSITRKQSSMKSFNKQMG